MNKLFTHAARQRELDEIAALPPERQEEKFARLDAVRRINRREEKIAIGVIFILAFFIFSILGFIVGYLLIPKFYSNALRELSERTENMDERSATYRINAMLAAARNYSNATGESS